jgi:FecR protein
LAEVVRSAAGNRSDRHHPILCRRPAAAPRHWPFDIRGQHRRRANRRHPADTLADRDDIVFQEDISTGADAKTVIEFRDGSTFEVGPDAVIRIDEFVFNPEESVGNKTLSVTRGVFRYVSGFVTNDQDAKISLPQGTIGIRGSVVVGIVDPAVPAFLHVAQGSATFTNDAGNRAIGAGQSIATPSRTTLPMRPDTMPAAVAAQTLQAIERRLPPPAILRSRPAPGDQQSRREATANLLPAAQQLNLQRAGRPGRPVALPGSRTPIARELGLLAEAQTYHLFDGASPQRTREQQSFLTRAEQKDPEASALVRRSDADARSLHEFGATSGTVTVMRGVAAVAPSADVCIGSLAAARANPAVAGIITRTSLAASRVPDRDRAEDLFRHVTAGPTEPRRSASAHPATRHPVNAEPRQKTAKAEQTGKRRRRAEDQQLR